MQRLIKIYILITLLGLVSCSRVSIPGVIEQSQKENFIRVLPQISPLCGPTDSGVPRIEFYSQSSTVAEYFEQLLSNQHFHSLNDHEFLAVFILIHLYVRPETANPSARLQFLMGTDEDIKYFDWGDEEMGILKAIEELLRGNSRRNLRSLIQLTSAHLPRAIPVERELQDFLQKNQKKIFSNERLRSIYIKGNQTVRVGETFNSPPLTQLLNPFLGDLAGIRSEIYPLQYLFPLEEFILDESEVLDDQDQVQTIELSCSFDMNLYRQGIHLVGIHQPTTHLDFGYFNHISGNKLIGSFASNQNKIALVNDTFISQGPIKQASFCYYRDPKTRVWFSSSQGRDSGQFLYRLIDNLQMETLSKGSIIEGLNRPRQLRLYYPDRYLFETPRADSAQIRAINSLGIPVYHSHPLGAIQVFANLKTNQEESFQGLIPDGRWRYGGVCLR